MKWKQTRSRLKNKVEAAKKQNVWNWNIVPKYDYQNYHCELL